jgi:hypothetical protein
MVISEHFLLKKRDLGKTVNLQNLCGKKIAYPSEDHSCKSRLRT